jgi:Flp pilus assembly pilin Flp
VLPFLSLSLSRLPLALRRRLAREDGQTTAEYALVLVGAGVLAALVATLGGAKVPHLLDLVFDAIEGHIS